MITNFKKYLSEKIYYHGTALPKNVKNIDKFQTRKGIRNFSFIGSNYEVVTEWIFLTSDIDDANHFAFAKKDYYDDKSFGTHYNKIINVDVNEDKLITLDLTCDIYTIEEKLLDIGLTLREIYDIQVSEEDFKNIPQSYGMSPREYFGLNIEEVEIWCLLDDKNISDKIKRYYNSVLLPEPDTNSGISLAIDINKQDELLKIKNSDN